MLLGKTRSHSHIYPLSTTEQQAMEDYVQEALQQGYIHPSNSLASTRLLFVEIKG